MKNAVIIGLVFFSVGILNGHEKVKHDFSTAIDQQIWEPFKQAYKTRDATLYLSIHADDILRVTKDGIRSGAAFRENIIKWYKKDNNQRSIDFKFEHRIHDKDIAYEVGYYKSTFTPENGESKVSIGRFHVVIIKINGSWKITQDWDTDVINGYVFSEKDFDKL